MENVDFKNRLAYIDWIKALGIFFVCIGHFLPAGSVIRIFLYTFHVPIFFIVSGITAKNVNTGEDFFKALRNLFTRMLIPYVFWFCLSNLPFLILGKKSFLLFCAEFLFINGAASWNSALWFIPCLFTVIVISNLLSLLKINAKIMVAIAVLLASFAIVLDILGIDSFLLGLNKSAMLFGFYVLGNILRKNIFKISKFKYGTILYGAIFIIVGTLYVTLYLITAIILAFWIATTTIIFCFT